MAHVRHTHPTTLRLAGSCRCHNVIRIVAGPRDRIIDRASTYHGPLGMRTDLGPGLALRRAELKRRSPNSSHGHTLLSEGPPPYPASF